MSLTPDAWHLAMQAALDNYKAELERWKAEPTEENMRRLQLAWRHVDAIDAQRPEPYAITKDLQPRELGVSLSKRQLEEMAGKPR